MEEVKERTELIFYSIFQVKLSSLEKYYVFRILTCNIQRMIYLNKGSSSSQAIYKSILRVIQNVWHDQSFSCIFER